MEALLNKIRQGRAPDEVENLCLDNCEATEISGLTDEYKNLQSLSIVNVGLTSLKNFPTLPKLKRLDLSDNRISGDLNVLTGSPGLVYLNLSGNQIKDLETLQPLKNLKELHNLDLFNCEVSNVEGYREKVFELLEGLLYLDGFDKNDQEAEDDGDEDDEDDDEEDEVGLEYLQKSGLEDESEEDEFVPGEDEENEADDLDDECDESDEEPSSRGTKRKRDDDDDEENTK